MRQFKFQTPLLALALASGLLAGCHTSKAPGSFAPRTGDEIMVAGQRVHTGTKVVLWTDPGGYDAYRVERRFAPVEESDWETSKEKVKGLSTPNRYGLRKANLSQVQLARVRGGGWELDELREVVDQFVIHFDVCGTSRQCFKVLHDLRCLSVHFMLDVDGTIYQTLDLKERAWHASVANTRSIGVEIANMGAYPPGAAKPLAEWYQEGPDGTRLTIPERFGDGGVLTPNFQGRPARPEKVVGSIQGTTLAQYDYTPEQYAALIKLTAALCAVFPNLKCDYPKDAEGRLIPQKLPEEEFKNFQGVIGHYHIQANKVDPGPAFQWDLVVEGARKELRRNRGGKSK